MAHVYLKTVVRIDRGTRYNCGTDWPVIDKIDRFCRPGERPVWISTKGLCNRVADFPTQEHKTLKAARARIGV